MRRTSSLPTFSRGNAAARGDASLVRVCTPRASRKGLNAAAYGSQRKTDLRTRNQAPMSHATTHRYSRANSADHAGNRRPVLIFVGVLIASY
jgi:hypothetical protein